MQSAIKKSIEGGWRCHAVNQAYLLFDFIENIDVFVNGFGWVIFHRKGTEAIGGVFTEKADSMRVEQVYSDPTFWQALGKAEGWKNEPVTTKITNEKIGEKIVASTVDAHLESGWMIQWHRFIDHLAEGKDAESFFKNLLK